jgi:thiol:disulfide interchange protein DsbD
MRYLLTFVLLLASTCLAAQDLELNDPFGEFGSIGDEAHPTISFSLHPLSDEAGAPIVLAVEALIPDGYYTYPLGDSPTSTQLKVTESTGLDAIDTEATSDHPAKVVIDKVVGRYEKYEHKVVWLQRFQPTQDADPASITVTGEITLNICFSGGCLPPETFPIEVSLGDGSPLPQNAAEVHAFSATVEPAAGAVELTRIPPILWDFRLTPAHPKPGDEVKLELTAELGPEYHIFSQTQDKKAAGLPTQITLTALRGMTPLDSGFIPDREFESKTIKLGDKEFEHQIYHGLVTWTQRFKVADSASQHGVGVMVELDYQYCKETSCTRDQQTVELGYVSLADKPTAAVGDQDSDSGSGFDMAKLEVPRDYQFSLAWGMLLAFVAGLILNFMPCVLPVIGLKIMSFVEQAGLGRAAADGAGQTHSESAIPADARKKIFMLNLAFALGMIFVYLILATLAVTIRLGWGGQFSSLTFNIVLVAVVFVFALSFLGVWEIPIPGFSSTTAAEGEGEGFAGAFSVGMLTTVLATPCSGPLLFPALTYAISQPVAVTYLVFFMVGLGMACPYLLIGAFPALISVLPRPGMWMETFKHVMGFVLLGTVVWLLTIVAAVSLPAIVPVIGFLFALWATCWWFGKVPLTKGRPARIKALLQATAFSVLVGWMMFSQSGLRGVMESRYDSALERLMQKRQEQLARAAEPDADSAELDWQQFSLEKLTELTSQDKTVFMDFTADW